MIHIETTQGLRFEPSIRPAMRRMEVGDIIYFSAKEFKFASIDMTRYLETKLGKKFKVDKMKISGETVAYKVARTL